MKKLLFALGAIALCLAGCDEKNESNSPSEPQTSQDPSKTDPGTSSVTINDVCDMMLLSNYDLESLTADQKAQASTAFTNACAAYYTNVPVCKDEFFNYYKCIYVDNTPEYWMEQKNKEYECDEQFEEDAANAACKANLFLACKTPDQTLTDCYHSNEDSLEIYYDEAESGEAALESLLISWGLDPKDYLGEW